MSLWDKLQAVQLELKAPKNQRNKFGNYNYRSCEDILEAAKPILNKHKAAIVVGDDIVQVGERYYIKATARFYDTEKGDCVENTAFAREAAEKKGMDEAQITGTASSYARKYALNGLLLIDDTKDADTNENHLQTSGGKPADKPVEGLAARVANLKCELERTGKEAKSFLAFYKIKYDENKTLEQNLAQLTEFQYSDAMAKFAKAKGKA